MPVDAVPATTILEGIREVAPDAEVTYSPDGSAPADGAEVGIVVVGETPDAEGYGDVAGPECGWCPAPRQEEKSLSPQPGDKAVIDRVCGAISRCVVLVVSGRPQVLTFGWGLRTGRADWHGSSPRDIADRLVEEIVARARDNAQEAVVDGRAPHNWGAAHRRQRTRAAHR